MNEIIRCTRCILPSSFPGIHFNDEGVCNVCEEYDQQWGSWSEKNWSSNRKKLDRILKHVRKLNRPYDCLVPFSGGKDSTYVLYLCTKVFKLKVLAVNVSNGFQTAEALDNIRKAVEALEVDLITYKPSLKLYRELARAFLFTTGEGCTPCNIGVVLTINRIAEQERIPLIFSGVSRKSDERSPKEIYMSGGEYFLKVIRKNGLNKRIKGSVYQDQERQLGLPFRIKRKLARLVLMDKGVFKYLPKKLAVRNSVMLQMPDFIEWNEDLIFKTIREELGWEESDVGKEHTDCRINPVKGYLRYHRWGFGAKTQKLAALVRDGQMDRESALMDVKQEDEVPEKSLEYFKRELNLNDQEMEQIYATTHEEFIN